MPKKLHTKKLVLKNLQNKKFCIKLYYTMFQKFLNLNMIFILYYLLHMKMKKLLVGAFLWVFALAGVAVLPNYADAVNWANPDPSKNELSDNDQTLTKSALLDTVRNAINWILWILATIALVICLYGWFKMITAGGDEKKYWDGLKVLKQAAIWLAIVWLSWMIVSVIFWFIGTLWWANQTSSGSNNGQDNAGSLRDDGNNNWGGDQNYVEDNG